MTRTGSQEPSQRGERAWPFVAAISGFVSPGLGIVVLLSRAALLPLAAVLTAVVLTAALSAGRVLVQRQRLVRSVHDLASELRASAYVPACSSALALAAELSRLPAAGR